METEQRLADLEESTRNALAESIAMDCIVHALIATHPDQDALREAFRGYVAAWEIHLSDHAFSTGRPTKVPQAVLVEVKRHVARIFAFFQ